MDDQLRDAAELLIWEMLLFYGDPDCVCGCSIAEHVVVTSRDVTRAPCRSCLCNDYEPPVTLND